MKCSQRIFVVLLFRFCSNGDKGAKNDLHRGKTSAIVNKFGVLNLQIQVISGHYLPKPPENPPIFTDIIDPYVIVEVYGFPCDQQKFRTKVIDNNGTELY